MKKLNQGIVLVGFFILPAAIGVFSSKLSAVECNKKRPKLPLKICNADWDNDAYCQNWNSTVCGTHSGVSTSNGASWRRTCDDGTGGASTDDCVVQDWNCKQKFTCRWIDTISGCRVGTAHMPPTYAQTPQAVARSCTPAG